MSKKRMNQKLMKAGRLLVGMRDPRIAPFLKPFGCTSKTLEDAWQLFLKASEVQLNLAVMKRPVAENSWAELDRFEARWAPVAKIVLQAQYPAMAEALFAGLESGERQSSVASVAVFLDRLEAMAAGEAPFGSDGPLAREYLRTRGLLDEVVASALAERQRVQTLGEADPVSPDRAPAKEAEAAIWAFYLEWSALARHAIKDGNLLRILGFKKRTGGRRRKAASVVVAASRTMEGATPVPLLLAE